MDQVLFSNIVLFCNLTDNSGDFTPETERKLMLLEQAGDLLARLRMFSSSPVFWGGGYRYLRVLDVINRAHKRYMRRLKAIK